MKVTSGGGFEVSESGFWGKWQAGGRVEIVDLRFLIADLEFRISNLRKHEVQRKTTRGRGETETRREERLMINNQ